MVSSGTVSENLNTAIQSLSKYNSIVSELDGSWKGNSHDNFVSKANSFYSEYSSGLNTCMSSFAEACNLYEQYIQAKRNLEICNSNVSQANSVNDKSAASSWSSKASEYQTEMNSLKGKIESALSSAKSVKLEASSFSGAPSSTATTKPENSGTSTSTNTGVVTDAQQHIADVASVSSGGGYDGYCEAWAEVTWQNATGIQRQNQVSAYDAWKNFGVSTSRDNIPVGAMVYGSGSDTVGGNNNPYGHVGIYLGNGQVADQGGVVSMDTWLSWQTANCDGHVGYIGWGWQNGVDLSKA